MLGDLKTKPACSPSPCSKTPTTVGLEAPPGARPCSTGQWPLHCLFRSGSSASELREVGAYESCVPVFVVVVGAAADGQFADVVGLVDFFC